MPCTSLRYLLKLDAMTTTETFTKRYMHLVVLRLIQYVLSRKTVLKNLNYKKIFTRLKILKFHLT